MRTAPGDCLAGRYAIVGLIGRGGMGRVWRAHDLVLDRDVALKELLLPLTMSAAARQEMSERLLKEARIGARLRHPAIVRVYDVLTVESTPWLVMELITGRSLEDVLADGPLPPARVAEIGVALLGALSAAHAAGILHRDVKPANVIVDDTGQVSLTDFGIAYERGQMSLTASGVLLGSPPFLAPERLRGEAADVPSDLFSLGATLYAAVEGRGPFDREGPLPTMAAILNNPPDPPRQAGPLAPVLFGLLEKDQRSRLTAARAEQELLAIAEAPATATPVEREPARRRRVVVALAATAVVLLGAAAIAFLVRPDRPAAESRVRSVDWKNHTYDLPALPGCPAVTGLTAVGGLAKRGADTWVVDQGGKWNGPLYADLDGNRTTDALIRVDCQTERPDSYNIIAELAAADGRLRAYQVAQAAADGTEEISSVSVAGGTVRVDVSDSGGNLRSRRYRWNGTSFARFGAGAIENVDWGEQSITVPAMGSCPARTVAFHGSQAGDATGHNPGWSLDPLGSNDYRVPTADLDGDGKPEALLVVDCLSYDQKTQGTGTAAAAVLAMTTQPDGTIARLGVLATVPRSDGIVDAVAADSGVVTVSVEADDGNVRNTRYRWTGSGFAS
ncbi:serine/threonine-protein kinase [Fodinicola acaciae]|uniref:serine/threonine-protein kinase n=1 Tax=Fodinicola acaciae TaxID=2681555 RepID=UPI0013D4D47F|nr:serine/threonine-protein kinase [Fodinicola acaciae]